MSHVRYIHRRGDAYYVRRPIPPDVQHAFAGKKEVWRSLGTTSQREAEARSHAVNAELTAKIEAARRARQAGSAEDAFIKSDEFLRMSEARGPLVRRMHRGSGWPTRLPKTAAESDHLRLVILSGAVEYPPGSRAEAIAAIDADLAALEQQRDAATLVIGMDEDGEPYWGVPERHIDATMAFIYDLFEADRRSLEAQRAILMGEASAAQPSEDEPASVTEGRTLSDLMTLWVQQRAPARSSQADARTAIARFERVNGKLAYPAVTDEHARRFKADLLKDSGSKTATRKKLWGLLRAIFNVAVEDRLLTSNPFDNIKLTLKDDSVPREVLTRDDLNALFDVLAQHDREEWWITRIGLFTGARLGEIVQLRRADIVTVAGVVVLDIREDATEDRRVKTRSSIRKVPVHRQLMADGFLAWVEARPDGPLFTLGAHQASKRLNRRMQEAGLGEGKVFHSLRHTFKGVARRHMAEEWHDRLTGHASKSVGQGYGDYELVTLREKIDLISFGL